MATPLQMPTDPSSIPATLFPFPFQIPSVDGTLGMVLIGTFLGLILYGLTLHQVYHYARTFPGDSLWLKTLVGITVLLETCSSILSMHMCYYFMVTNYFRPQDLGASVWSLDLFYAVSGTTMVVSQSFFARRLWLLGSRSYRLVVMLSCVSGLAELAIFIAASTITFTTDDPGNLVAARLLPSAFALAMVSDLSLTASLIYVLHRKRTGFKSTDTMIDVLILYAINTGLLNGIFDLTTAIVAFAQPHGHLYGVFGIPGVKLYAITLLAALNCRRTIEAQSASIELQDCDRDIVFGVSVTPSLTASGTSAPVSLGARFRAHQLSAKAPPGEKPGAIIDFKIVSSSSPSNGDLVEEPADRTQGEGGLYPHGMKIDAGV